MKILTIGPLWRGSNAGGLFHALSRKGCLIDVVDEFYFISLRSKKKFTKILERIIRPFQLDEFNDAIKAKIVLFKPDVLLVYKGTFVYPATLKFAKQHNCKIALFFPDISTTNHGPNIPASIPLYDLIFTTKTFGITDMKSKYGTTNAYFVPHGFDPEIHRKLAISNDDLTNFGCDVSFIGTWSPKKEKWLSFLKENIPDLNMKIWGDQWNKATSKIIQTSIQGTPVLGDFYVIALQCSKINLGILLEQIVGSSSGDLITSRTFHIPAASGFMLHERNQESVLYFKENEEAGFFEGEEELVIKVKEFLNDEGLREKIRMAGHKRALECHSLDARAEIIINHFKALK